jgi:hypothetical protein
MSTICGLDNRVISVQFLGGARYIFLHSIQTGFAYSANIKNGGTIPPLHCVFMALLIKQRDNFILPN